MPEIRTARESLELGLSRYFTGLPCRRGHVDERMVSNGICVGCLRERRIVHRKENSLRVKNWKLANPGATATSTRLYRLKYPERESDRRARYRAKNLERVRQDDRERARIRRSANPEAAKARRLEFEARREAKRVATAGRPRAMVCELCSVPGRTVWDHDHATGVFRGWICDRCNKVLGLVKDNRALLQAMADYVEGNDGRTDDCQKGQAA